MNEQDLKRAILSEIYSGIHNGTGWRTTETDQLYRKVITGRRHAKNDKDQEWYDCHPPHSLMKRLLFDLYASKEIKFVTEVKHRNYCWIVPRGWEDKPMHGYIHIPKIACEPFDIW
jgi:hypothetical protein